jgi:hypothetical protein
MDLNEMRNLVRRDLRDNDPEQYVWSDDELNGHIASAVRDFSEALPLEQKAALATTAGLREIDISGLTDLIVPEALEYPAGRYPACYCRFSFRCGTLLMLDAELPDGSQCAVYYLAVHVLDGSGSTIPDRYSDLIAAGSCGYAAMQEAGYSINRINTGGSGAAERWLEFGKTKLDYFYRELKRIGKNNRVRQASLYHPYFSLKSKTTDWGP